MEVEESCLCKTAVLPHLQGDPCYPAAPRDGSSRWETHPSGARLPLLAPTGLVQEGFTAGQEFSCTGKFCCSQTWPWSPQHEETKPRFKMNITYFLNMSSTLALLRGGGLPDGHSQCRSKSSCMPAAATSSVQPSPPNNIPSCH